MFDEILEFWAYQHTAHLRGSKPCPWCEGKQLGEGGCNHVCPHCHPEVALDGP